MLFLLNGCSTTFFSERNITRNRASCYPCMYEENTLNNANQKATLLLFPAYIHYIDGYIASIKVNERLTLTNNRRKCNGTKYLLSFSLSDANNNKSRKRRISSLSLWSVESTCTLFFFFYSLSLLSSTFSAKPKTSNLQSSCFPYHSFSLTGKQNRRVHAIFIENQDDENDDDDYGATSLCRFSASQHGNV